MKKAKFVLSAVAVFAVIGGALAFNAQRTGSVQYFTNSTIAPGQVVCTVATSADFFTTDPAVSNGTSTIVIPQATLTAKQTACLTSDKVTIYSAN
jgi:hypothetical protein